MKLTRPKKITLVRLVQLLSLLQHVERKNLERGIGTALDLKAIADVLSSDVLWAWHATAAAQLRERESKRRQRRTP